MSSSAWEGPPRRVTWLFFNPKNHRSRVYPIEVPRHLGDAAVEQLRWSAALKKRFKFRAKESTIQFRRPNSPLPLEDVDRDWIKTIHDIEGVSRLCQPDFRIGQLFDESYDPDHTHFFITAEELMQDEDSVGSAEERQPVLESALDAMHRRFREGRVPLRVPPSVAAAPREHARLQRNPKTVIYNGFYAGEPHRIITTAPPVRIFHPVFEEFLDRVENPAFEPDEEVVSLVFELMSVSTRVHPSGDNALTEPLRLLSELLGGFLGEAASAGTPIPDGTRFKQLGETIVPLVLVEYKCAFGEGGCDPAIQASYSVREFLVSTQSKTILEKCCCPCFLLVGRGPHLFVLGAVYTDKFIVQQLTNIPWIGEASTHEDVRAHSIARVFTSLRLALTALDTYYGRVWEDPYIPAYAPPKPHPRLFPYPTKFDKPPASVNAGPECTEFEYIDAFSANPNNVTLLARVKSSNQKLVVKFVDRYGVDAHQLLADEGMAPRLLYCGPLDGKTDVRTAGTHSQGGFKACGLYVGPIRMVIMEFIEGKTAEKVSPIPSDAREKTRNAIEKLHDAQLVLGDLRAPNVMFSGNEVFLIDFDWAGRVGEARYPMHLSRAVRWPARPEELELKPILMEDDRFMLDQLFPSNHLTGG